MEGLLCIVFFCVFLFRSFLSFGLGLHGFIECTRVLLEGKYSWREYTWHDMDGRGEERRKREWKLGFDSF